MVIFNSTRAEIRSLRLLVCALAEDLQRLEKQVGTVALAQLRQAETDRQIAAAATAEFERAQERAKAVEARMARLEEWRG